MPIKIQEAYRTPNTLDQKNKKQKNKKQKKKTKTSSSHIIVTTPNAQNKERILKAVREKGHIKAYKGRPMRITPDFSPETMKVRRSWTDPKKTQMPAQVTVSSKTPNYHRWRN